MAHVQTRCQFHVHEDKPMDHSEQHTDGTKQPLRCCDVKYVTNIILPVHSGKVKTISTLRERGR